MVNSGGGLHVYWLLTKPVNVRKNRARFEAATKGVARHLGADPVSTDIARILRVPGTFNFKFTPPKPVFIESWCPERKYEFEEFVPAVFQEPAPRLATSDKKPRSASARVAHRARRYLRACPKPVIDNGSDHQTYRVGAKLIGTAGDDFGLTIEEALLLLCEWQPAFDPGWFRKKLENVQRYARGGQQ